MYKSTRINVILFKNSKFWHFSEILRIAYVINNVIIGINRKNIIINKHVISFVGRCANREWWARLITAAKTGGAAAFVLEFIALWCGPADYRPL